MPSPLPKSAPWIAVGLVLLALVAAKFDPRTGFAALIRFGAEWESRRMEQAAPLAGATVRGSGYDGQFYAQLALDPTLRDPGLAPALDAPAYRARRILVPAAAHALGLGQPGPVLQVFALLNVACWFVFAFILRREIGGAGPEAFARWFACVFSLGVLDSVRQSLVDLPALTLVLLAVRAARRPNPAAAAGWSALAHLAKETSALASLALLAFPARRPRGWLLFAAALVPLAAWLAYVHARLPAGGTGLGNFTWPLWGAASQVGHAVGRILAGDLDSRHVFALIAIAGLGLQAVVLLRLRRPDDPWWRIGVAHVLLLAVLGPWVWSGYWAACRAVLPLTIAFNLLLPPGRAFWPLLIAGNLTLLHGVWRFL